MIANDRLERDAIYMLDHNYEPHVMYIDAGMLPEDINEAKAILVERFAKLNIIIIVAVNFCEDTITDQKFFKIVCEDKMFSQVMIYEIEEQKVRYIQTCEGADTYYDNPYLHLLRQPFSLS